MTDLVKEIEQWYKLNSKEEKSKNISNKLDEYQDPEKLKIKDLIDVANACYKYGLGNFIENSNFSFLETDDSINGIYYIRRLDDGISSIILEIRYDNKLQKNKFDAYKHIEINDRITMNTIKSNTDLLPKEEFYFLDNIINEIDKAFEYNKQELFNKIEEYIKSH